jgi:dual specificity protein kinase YAK1
MVHGKPPSSPNGSRQQTAQESTAQNVADQDKSAKAVGTAPVPVEGWQPPVFCKSNFRPYSASTRADGGTAKGEKQKGGSSANSSATIRKIARRASVELLEVYQQCKSDFRYTRSLNPRRCLTKPSEPVDAHGSDNSDSDLIVYVNDVLVSTSTGRKYVVLDKLGQGTFGQARQPTKPF